ncbi:MAG: hypothetical protein ACREBR_04575 [bacterium]
MERVMQDPTDPKFVPSSPGMNAEAAKAFAALAGVVTPVQADPKLAMARMIAQQTGKSLEEVMAFMGTSAPATAPAAIPVESAPAGEILEEVPASKPAKVVVPVAEVPGDDKFIVTEIVDLEDASEADLDRLAKEEEDAEQDWSGKIRVGSRVKIIYQVSASRINWIGKKGKVTRIVGNEAAKVFDVEFQGGKIPKIRLNKKTGKLERGYEKKVIRNTFSEDQLELAD